MKIGLSYWGICAEFDEHKSIFIDTPDGHRYARPLLVKALEAAGHEVYALQERREPNKFSKVRYVCEEENMLPELDVIFLEWRWSTFKNDKTHPMFDNKKYEPDLYRQREIIEFYRHKCPIIAWDTDLKITKEDEDMYPELIFSDPSVKTNKISKDRVSIMFWTNWKQLFPISENYPVYGYVGNNYERPTEFKKFYYDSSGLLRTGGIQTSMYGNWLQTSHEREKPQTLISENRNVAFNHRMNFYDSMYVMSKFIATTHVSKTKYYESGFISPRYLEALVAGCPGLVPKEQLCNKILGKEFIVDNASDVYSKVMYLSKLTAEQRAEVVQQQQYEIQKFNQFDVKNVVNYIESLV